MILKFKEASLCAPELILARQRWMQYTARRSKSTLNKQMGLFRSSMQYIQIHMQRSSQAENS